MKRIHKAYTIILFIFALAYIKAEAQNPNWSPPVGNAFQFSANVIAQIKLSDITSNNVNDKIAFFDGAEMRGLGNAVALGNGVYRHFITVYSNHPLDTLIIKVYHQGTDHVYEVQQPFIFQSQSITGSVDNAYTINIYPDNNAPIWLVPVPSQSTIEGLPFDPIDMAQYLVQPDEYPVDWTYTINPNLSVNFNGSILNVNAVSGFTGQTFLTVRATEQSMVDRLLMEGDRNNQQDEHYAEVNIEFNVIPLYDAPLWQPLIPGQGIITGQQFDTIPLHTYENQYTGTSIRYDYRPVLEEKIPNDTLPGWQITNTYGTTMSVVARPDYTPKHQFNFAGDVLAAFSDNELRGIAQRNPINGLFYLSIGGNNVNNDTITLVLYSSEMKRILTKEKLFVFEPYGILGDDELPYSIEFAPIVPVIPDVDFVGGIYDMPVNIVDENFIGSMTFTFSAMDPMYPLYLRDDIDVTFCIAVDSTSLSLFYQDLDGDGLGNPLVSVMACNMPEGYVTNDDDCNDNGVDNSISISISENSGIPNDGIICTESNVNLSVVQNAQSYQWSSGHTTQSIQLNPSVTTAYSVTVTFMAGCVFTKSDTIIVEGLVVRNSNNSGFGTLRNVIYCAVEGDTITYDLANITGTSLTQQLTIDKTLTIQGTLNSKPEIVFDYSSQLSGLIIEANKKLILENIDIKTINSGSQKTFNGTGSIDIIATTNFTSE